MDIATEVGMIQVAHQKCTTNTRPPGDMVPQPPQNLPPQWNCGQCFTVANSTCSCRNCGTARLCSLLISRQRPRRSVPAASSLKGSTQRPDRQRPARPFGHTKDTTVLKPPQTPTAPLRGRSSREPCSVRRRASESSSLHQRPLEHLAPGPQRRASVPCAGQHRRPACPAPTQQQRRASMPCVVLQRRSEHPAPTHPRRQSVSSATEEKQQCELLPEISVKHDCCDHEVGKSNIAFGSFCWDTVKDVVFDTCSKNLGGGRTCSSIGVLPQQYWCKSCQLVHERAHRVHRLGEGIGTTNVPLHAVLRTATAAPSV